MQYHIFSFTNSSQSVCRYDYHCGLRQGVSDLVARDQAVAKALVQLYYRRNVELFLAFVTKEETGHQCTLLMCPLVLAAEDLFMDENSEWHVCPLS